ncbi:MAG TPA: class I SAM-dependent methyltransferase, partial [Beutenbergiaceae bacterium]|nr:class I SAM-dependent methyltransferase [Beutenbergiaceae bacterium]
MIAQAQSLNASTGIDFPLTVADARRLPFDNASFDQAFTAFGAIPFVKNPQEVHREVFRVLRPGGVWTFATTHPMRWAFPDDPDSLTVTRSYFDRTPYAETTAKGTYAEFHRTLGDHINDVITCGFTIGRILEPEWVEGNTHVWGGWSPTRGTYLPGTLIIQVHRPTGV